MRPRLLDLFCGAGGAAMGYHRAGFEVVGVDIVDQPNYPFTFYLDDALTYLREMPPSRLRSFDAIHASPPCQAHVAGLAMVNRTIGRLVEHPDLIDQTRRLLLESALPYVIENVPGAPLKEPVRLCGSSFGLNLWRHRLFECSFPVLVFPCAHHLHSEARFWNGDRSVRNTDGSRSYEGHGRLSKVVQVYGNAGGREEWAAAMGIDWMTNDELVEAIPPAYTEHIGGYLLAEINARAAA